MQNHRIQLIIGICSGANRGRKGWRHGEVVCTVYGRGTRERRAPQVVAGDYVTMHEAIAKEGISSLNTSHANLPFASSLNIAVTFFPFMKHEETALRHLSTQNIPCRSVTAGTGSHYWQPVS